jgi:methionyl-tRNA formyltransferase
MNVLLVADAAAGERVLRALAERGIDIVAVMALQPRPERSASLWDRAAELGYATWPAQWVKDPAFAEEIRRRRVDVLLNVHSLYLIRQEVLEAPRLGSFNLHPGPLPRYAGLNSVSWAICRGEREHGVTLHKMEPNIDGGPIAYQAAVPIDPKDTGLSLTTKCVNAGIPLVLHLIETASRAPAEIPAVPQDLSKREYFGRDIPDNGNLSWARPARQVVDFVRACDYAPFESPWGMPRTRLRECNLAICQAALTGRPAAAAPGTVGVAASGAVEVACADEWVMVSRVRRGREVVAAAKILSRGDRLTDTALAGALAR